MSFINIGMGRFCVEKRTEPFGIIIFGASGDLTKRKLIPSVFNLFKRKLLPDKFYVLGCARTHIDNEKFLNDISEKLSQEDKTLKEEFLKRCSYVQCDYNKREDHEKLLDVIENNEQKFNTGRRRIFYLSVPPSIYLDIIKNLYESKLSTNLNGINEYARIIAEKPFGHDLKSSITLDEQFKKYLHEDQIYRIDHYLGKETVQNLLMFRFANIIFEAVWNRNYIDNVQITVSESLGVGNRAGYYDKTGLLRDMFQNHVLQVLALAAMEQPISFDAEHIRNEKVKLLKSIRNLTEKNIQDLFIRGQYSCDTDNEIISYLEEPEISKDSQTETFVAAKLYIDNWRWKGVPFYIRSGKRLKKRASEIAITFKQIPHSVFHPYLTESDFDPNVLRLNIQPDEGFSLEMQAKHPGPKLCIGSLEMGVKYREVFGSDIPDAYERLLLDCILGDQTLFIRSDDLKVSWSIFTPVLELWENFPEKCPLYKYKPGTYGPKEADELIERDGRKWIEP